MPTLQTVLPTHVADEVERDAKSRTPPDSVSRVLAEIVVPAIEARLAARVAEEPTAGKGGE